MARIHTLRFHKKLIQGLYCGFLFASVAGGAYGKSALHYNGIDGCYLDKKHCSSTDCVASVKQHVKRVEEDRRTILQQFASHPGSKSASPESLNGLLLLKFLSPDTNELFAGRAISDLESKVLPTEHSTRLPAMIKGYNDDQAIELYTPEKNLKAFMSAGDGRLQENEITNWRRWSGNCDNQTKNVYFSRPVDGKQGRIIAACIDPERCSMKLQWIKKFKNYDVYEMTAPKGAAPDFLIVIDPTAGVGALIKVIHILRSTKNGWEMQYSGDYLHCESYC